ncbi:hypothetical protein PsorP6_000100 [Peronosclerospora sorghi]|uniref:Uncharacterized protein n=1 Tax=Peronosclerospora sorghi TaxID=230839 RepID=A0ACC0WW33_9STRA|nr:hypothetical protein PsorP6_000100 [Peronosclerospora sorghi]
MIDAEEVPSLLSEGLLSVLYHMLQSTSEFPRCAAAHAIKHLVPAGYDPDVTINVPPYLVDDHEELFLNSSLFDLQSLVKGHIAPINAQKALIGAIVTEAFLSGQICVKNVVDLLTLSEECNADDLKKNCVPFLMRHIHEIVRLPAFEEHRVRSSEEVLNALTTMLGPEWEESYAKLKQSIGHKDTKDEATRDDTETRNREEEVRETIGYEVNDVRESPLSPHFLMSAVPPSSASGNSAAFATESP